MGLGLGTARDNQVFVGLNTLLRGGSKKKTIESVIMVIPRRSRVKEARSIWSLILKIV